MTPDQSRRFIYSYAVDPETGKQETALGKLARETTPKQFSDKMNDMVAKGFDPTIKPDGHAPEAISAFHQVITSKGYQSALDHASVIAKHGARPAPHEHPSKYVKHSAKVNVSGDPDRPKYAAQPRSARDMLNDIDRLQSMGVDITAAYRSDPQTARDDAPSSVAWSAWAARIKPKLDAAPAKDVENNQYTGLNKVLQGIAKRGVDFNEKDKTGNTARDEILIDADAGSRNPYFEAALRKAEATSKQISRINTAKERASEKIAPKSSAPQLRNRSEQLE